MEKNPDAVAVACPVAAGVCGIGICGIGSGRLYAGNGDAHDAQFRDAVFRDVAKDELFTAPSALAGSIFNVSGLTLGYVYDIPLGGKLPLGRYLALGMGASGTMDVLPSRLAPSYGGADPLSYMLFTRIKIIAAQ